MKRFYTALEAQYQSRIEEAVAVLELYFNKNISCDDPSNVLDIMDKHVRMLEENTSKLQTLQRLFTPPPETQQPS